MQWNKQAAVPLLALSIILALTALCYWPSLSGPFIFDDYPNLSPIGNFGGIHSWEAFWQYIFSGSAGPLGRPISLASFTLNAQDWPAAPYPFRLTNLLIHLFNGLLVFCLASRLFRLPHNPRKAAQLALFATAFWLLHPLLVSTTAFVVQRMTQLAGTFSLLALIGYLHGRTMLTSQPRRAWVWIIGSMGLGGSLAVLSKESGALLPLFALCIEATIFAGEKTLQHKWLLALLWLPSLALLGYMLARLPGIEAAYARREFTVQERLFTEARIVMDYLSRLLFPRMQGAGLYHDDFALSTGLLAPASTLLSIICLAALSALAWLGRHKLPFISLGILWFLAGHILESTWIPLELYYEHRNYLPAVGLAIAAGSVCLPANENLRKLAPLLALLFIALAAFMTWQNAVMWSSQKNLVHINLKEHPTSLRALERAALYYTARRDYRSALGYLEQTASLHPKRNSIKLSVAQTKCLLDELAPQEFAYITKAIATGGYEKESILYLPEFTQLAAMQICEGISYEGLHALLDAFVEQAKHTKPRVARHLIHYHRANIYAAEGKYDKAIQALDASYASRPSIDILLLQAVWLISIHDFNAAQQYLDKAKAMNERRASMSINRERDINGYQRTINRGDKNPQYQPFVYPLSAVEKQH